MNNNTIESPKEDKCINCGMRKIHNEIASVHTGVMAITYACGTKVVGQLLETSEVCDEITLLKEQISSWNKLADTSFSKAVYELKKSLSFLAKLSEKNHKRVKGGHEALNAIIQHEGRLRHHADVNNRQVF
ncbi:hypothetical protein H0A36_27945 [Endozoicomonas sp. SM1973]|uniref:Uncharacterized protein n=1 Tax=Spartinivicinus marinus TaxID=2994442 RepID=A0A853IA99_9GAMM|nr:hypothetical protein [Spartinivicinus marinus]MCX4026978.1 hypothetical protein [Spartinivicinus marinus]MCX4027909.1 hypothetical protein [Spartinivicinus marinus]NYZ69849.1 hypothetical protein [Spartinivicinus marinus]